MSIPPFIVMLSHSVGVLFQYIFYHQTRVLHDNIIYFFFQAEDGIRDLVRSRGLGDVYKRQHRHGAIVWSCPFANLAQDSRSPALDGATRRQ